MVKLSSHVLYCKRMLVMHSSKRGSYKANTIREKAANICHWEIYYKDSVASLSDLDILDKAILLFRFFFFKCTLEFSFKSSIRRRCVWDWNDETILRHFDSELKDIFIMWAHLLIFLRTLFRLLVVSLTFPANTDISKEFS